MSRRSAPVVRPLRNEGSRRRSDGPLASGRALARRSRRGECGAGNDDCGEGSIDSRHVRAANNTPRRQRHPLQRARLVQILDFLEGAVLLACDPCLARRWSSDAQSRAQGQLVASPLQSSTGLASRARGRLFESFSGRHPNRRRRREFRRQAEARCTCDTRSVADLGCISRWLALGKTSSR
jgi:hypothetical protein